MRQVAPSYAARSSRAAALRIRMHENCKLDATTASRSFHSEGITRSSISHVSSSMLQ
jgi:hypothetical protein